MTRCASWSSALLLVGMVLFLILLIGCPGVNSVMTDGRHSYSLTTFNTDGKLEQVERALVASSLGPPIIAVITGETIILASPQLLPSPLMNDDGTSRFTLVSPHIVVGHSGITADGRVLIESAQRLAIEHAVSVSLLCILVVLFYDGNPSDAS